MPEAAVKETSAYKILQLQYSVAYQGEGWRGGECEGGGSVRGGSVRVVAGAEQHAGGSCEGDISLQDTPATVLCGLSG